MVAYHFTRRCKRSASSSRLTMPSSLSLRYWATSHVRNSDVIVMRLDCALQRIFTAMTAAKSTRIPECGFAPRMLNNDARYSRLLLKITTWYTTVPLGASQVTSATCLQTCLSQSDRLTETNQSESYNEINDFSSAPLAIHKYQFLKITGDVVYKF